MSVPTPAERPSLGARLLVYQRERFPLLAYGPMVVVFTASAAYYSRFARGAEGFIPAGRFAVGAFTALVFFAWLRILDEHKDAEADRRYRPELPVPRGLVTRAELRGVGLAALAVAVLLNLWTDPRLLLPMALVAGYAALMTREFFVGEWLRAHPWAYLLSHMAIMPLIDLYSTGLDWLGAGVDPPRALYLFLLLTYLNGIVIEIGRKIRVPEDERTGVDTYTAAWGLRAAPLTWLGVLGLTAVVAAVALLAIGASTLELVVLALVLLLAAAPAGAFLRQPTRRSARRIEHASGAWTILMYLALGAGRAAARGLGLG